MEKEREENLKQETNVRGGHMCVNPNICDICNGIATIEDKVNPTEKLLAKVVHSQEL